MWPSRSGVIAGHIVLTDSPLLGWPSADLSNVEQDPTPNHHAGLVPDRLRDVTPPELLVGLPAKERHDSGTTASDQTACTGYAAMRRRVR